MDGLYLIIILVLVVGFGVAFYLFYRYHDRQMKHEIRRAQKSEQLKSVFLGNASNALRSPLNAIKGYCDLIIEDKSNTMQPEQVREMVSHIDSNTQQLLTFISHLLDLTKYEGSELYSTRVEVNLAELMASYVREIQYTSKHRFPVHLKSGLSPHCKVFLDTNIMHQLMMHLLTNATTHTTQGDVTVSYSDERKGLKIVICYVGNGEAELIGDDIYSFLQREDALTQGNDVSGLGLAISRAIIDSLDGDLDIDTHSGRKTIVTVWFPCKMTNKHK